MNKDLLDKSYEVLGVCVCVCARVVRFFGLSRSLFSLFFCIPSVRDLVYDFWIRLLLTVCKVFFLKKIFGKLLHSKVCQDSCRSFLWMDL